MSLEQLSSIAAIRQFLEGMQAVPFGIATNKQERCQRVQKPLIKHRHLLLDKVDKKGAGSGSCN